MSNACQIHNDCFYTIAFAFNLGHDLLHLITIEWIGDILDTTRQYTSSSLQREKLTRRMLILDMMNVV